MGDLPQWLIIVLIVVASIIAIWVLLLIVNLIFFGFFNSVFKKHKKAMTVILYSKLENMEKLFAILKQSGIKIDDRLSKMLSEKNAIITILTTTKQNILLDLREKLIKLKFWTNYSMKGR